MSIAAEVENDQQETRSGSWGDDQTGSTILNKYLMDALLEVSKVVAQTEG
jgi:hypothetical protein